MHSEDLKNKAGANGAAWHCPRCGKRNISRARFCGGCGMPTLLPETLLSAAIAERTRLPEAATAASSQFDEIDEALSPKPAPIENRPEALDELKQLSVVAALPRAFKKICSICARFNDDYSGGIRKTAKVGMLAFPLVFLFMIWPWHVFSDSYQSAVSQTAARQMLESAKPLLFSDVPIDHPVYTAWKELLRLQPLSALALSDFRAAPYEPLDWEQWQALIAAVWKRCRPGEAVPAKLIEKSIGKVTAADLNSSLKTLSECLGMQSEVSAQYTFSRTPARIDAIAALSTMLKICEGKGI